MPDIFDVIADSTRREILAVLRGRSVDPATGQSEMSVSEIVTVLELSQPTVSKHLKVLREAGLVLVREDGQHRFYRLDSAPLEEIEDWVIPFTTTDAEISEFTTALADETREFASAVGKVLADTRHRVERVTPKIWRRE